MYNKLLYKCMLCIYGGKFDVVLYVFFNNACLLGLVQMYLIFWSLNKWQKNCSYKNY